VGQLKFQVHLLSADNQKQSYPSKELLEEFASIPEFQLKNHPKLALAQNLVLGTELVGALRAQELL
jgi:hypothetical protein